MAYSCPRCGIADEHAYLRCHRADCTDGRDTYGRTEASMPRVSASSERAPEATAGGGNALATTMSLSTGGGAAVIAHLGMTMEFGLLALMGWLMVSVPLVGAATYRTYERAFRGSPNLDQPHRCGVGRCCGVADIECGCEKHSADVDGLPV